MQGILVVSPRRIQGAGRFRVGQAETDEETRSFIARASVDQLAAAGKALDAARVLVSRPYGRLISGIMTPIVGGLEAVASIVNDLGLAKPLGLSECVGKVSEITSRVSELEALLSKSGNAGKAMAEAILAKDPSVRSVSYRDPEGIKEVLVASRGDRDVSLIAGNDLASIKAAADRAKEALAGTGYRLGWIAYVVGAVSALVVIIASITFLVHGWGPLAKDPVGAANARMAKITDDLIRIDKRILDIKDSLKILRSNPSPTQAEVERAESLIEELKSLEFQAKALQKEADGLSSNMKKIEDADNVFKRLDNVLAAGLSVLAYLGIGVAAILVGGTVIHFVTR